MCYENFARSLRLRDAEVGRDILYDIIESYRSVSDTARCLGLNYTHMDGAEQFWQCHPGLEYCVADPSPASSLGTIVRDSMPKEFLGNKASVFDFSHKVRNDPLDNLP